MSSAQFSLGTFRSAGTGFVGVVRDGSVWDIARLPGLAHVHDTLGLFADWAANEAALLAAMAAPNFADAIALSDLEVDAPIVPRQIFCSGANYRKHVIELTLKQPDPSTAGLTPQERAARVADMMDERARTGSPYAFVKLPSAVTGPFGHIILPSGAREVDWELELGVVIGQSARNITREKAMSIVAGYVVANDITSRDRVYRPDMKAIGTDWLAAKTSPTFLPLGPWIVPARFVADPQALQLTLRLNGQVMQDENTSDMIFDIARQIEYISSYVRLMPGDLICTGSPAGNGTHHERFMTPGDIVEGTITGLGTQRLTCVAEGPDGEPLVAGNVG